MFIPPKKDKINDGAHFIRTEIHSTDFKKENLISKVKKDNSKTPYIYKKETPKNHESNETIKLLDEIATFIPGKKAQLVAKKISQKCKKQREANAKKQKNKTSLIDDRTYQQLKDDDFISLAPKNKTSSFIDDRTYQELKDDDFIALESNEEVKQNDFIALESDKEVKKITDVHKKQKQKQKIEAINEIKKVASSKNKTTTANKILKKYKNMKKPKKTYLVNEEDLETIDYSEQENLFQGESIQIKFLTLTNLKNRKKKSLNIINYLIKKI